MECKKCGTVLDEDSIFCFSCGAKVVDESEQDSPVNEPTVEETPQEESVTTAPAAAEPISTKNTKETIKSIKSKEKLIGLIVGTLLIVIGLTRVMGAGTSITSTSFGGDFYTYTYQGIVAMTEQLASIQASLGWIIVAIGSAIDVFTLRK